MNPKQTLKNMSNTMKMAKKPDKDEYTQHFEISINWNFRSWYYWIYNSICVFGSYIWSIKLSEEIKSHLFAIRTTGGQEKVVMRLLEAKANANQINIQSVFWVSDLKGYVVVEAINPSDAYLAVEGVRHIRGQLRGELEFKDIEGYLIKKINSFNIRSR